MKLHHRQDQIRLVFLRVTISDRVTDRGVSNEHRSAGSYQSSTETATQSKLAELAVR